MDRFLEALTVITLGAVLFPIAIVGYMSLGIRFLIILAVGLALFFAVVLAAGFISFLAVQWLFKAFLKGFREPWVINFLSSIMALMLSLLLLTITLRLIMQ